MDQNAITTLGLCKRAGKLTVGSEKTEYSARHGGCRFILVASDVSDKIREKYKRLYEETDGITIAFPDIKMTELAAAVGQSGVLGVVSTDDGGFAKLLRSKFTDSIYGGNE